MTHGHSISMGGGARIAPTGKPLSVKDIIEEAQNFDYNPLIPLRYWFRTANTLLKEAEIYAHEGNEQQTFLLLYRHAQLVIQHLSRHPDVRNAIHAPMLAQAERDVQRNLPKMESLKPLINRRYERWQKHAQDRAAVAALRQNVQDGRPSSRGQQAGSGTPTSPQRNGSTNGFEQGGIRSRLQLERDPAKSAAYAERDPATAGVASLAADEHRDLAVRLARSEFKRRALARKATRQAGIPESVEAERRSAGVWGDWEDAFKSRSANNDPDSLREQMQRVRLYTETPGRSSADSKPSSGEPRRLSKPSYQYPRVPAHGRSSSTDATRGAPSSGRDSLPARGLMELLKAPSAAPIIPAKTPQDPQPPLSPEPLPPPVPAKDNPVPQSASAPLRPAKTPFTQSDSPQALATSDASLSSPSTVATTPSTAGSNASSATTSDLQPATFAFQPSAYLENGQPLRTIFLPPELRHRFLDLARSNTKANLETCGILCGTLISNALFISRLVIPEQRCTSDTCETVDEGRLFDYVDGEDLLVLGWIHTHPTQTCFMSSRDLHTQCGYQVMLPESIAIVCAPSRNEWGVFRLTDPPGMQSILNCTQTGLFHPHAQDHLYTDALRPGHVFEAKGLEFEVHDMRDGK